MLSPSKVEAFLAEPRNVIVVGIRGDGQPHVSPNWFFWDGARFYDQSRVLLAITPDGPPRTWTGVGLD